MQKDTFNDFQSIKPRLHWLCYPLIRMAIAVVSYPCIQPFILASWHRFESPAS